MTKDTQKDMRKVFMIMGIALLIAVTGYGFRKNSMMRGVPGWGTPGRMGDSLSGTVLKLSGKGLTSVPMGIFDRTDTTELDLSYNSLTGALPSQVGHLKNLKVLNLSYNKFTGVPAEVGQLKNLQILNLSYNELTGLPNELGELSSLRLLDLSGNNYSVEDLAGIRSRLPASTVIKTQ